MPTKRGKRTASLTQEQSSGVAQTLHATCEVKGCGYTVAGSSQRVLAVNMARHKREKHGDGDQVALQRRRQQQQSRMLAIRKQVLPLAAAAPAAQASGKDIHAEIVPSLSTGASGSAAAPAAQGVLKRPAAVSAEQGVRKKPSTAHAESEAPIADGWPHLFVVTAPKHRDHLWDTARLELIRFGADAQQVRRRTGIDMQAADAAETPLQRDWRCPEGLNRTTFLHYDFTECFLPYCAKVFRQHPCIEVIWWVEDDIKFTKDSDYSMLEHSAKEDNACMLWYGYLNVKGEPRYGSHFVGVTRAGIVKTRRHVRDHRSSGVHEAGTHLMGLDTFLYKLSKKCDEPMPLVRAAKSSWAGQRTHALKGRR